MAELTLKAYNIGGLNDELIDDFSRSYDWKKVEINNEKTQMDLYVSDKMFFRFENLVVSSTASNTITSIKITVYKDDKEIYTNAGSQGYAFLRVETLKTTNTVMFKFCFGTNILTTGGSSGNNGRLIVTTARNVETDEEAPIIIHVTDFSAGGSNIATIYSDDGDSASMTGGVYSLSLFSSFVTSIAPLTNQYSKYAAKYVYTVHSSQLGGVNLHAPALINNVNYYLYGTLAFRE